MRYWWNDCDIILREESVPDLLCLAQIANGLSQYRAHVSTMIEL